MSSILSILHWVAAFVIIAEALNKLERTDPFNRNLSPRARVVAWLGVASWSSIALGAAGVLVAPLLAFAWPLTPDIAVVWGLALWIITMRTRAHRSRADDIPASASR